MSVEINKEIENILKNLAKQISQKAYCPYSNYAVGAALISSNYNYYSGCNVENASYGLTSCAERNAVFQMIAAGDQSIEYLIIYTPTKDPVLPCGACRQVLNEFSKNLMILSFCDSDKYNLSSLNTLLPNAFGPKNLL